MLSSMKTGSHAQRFGWIDEIFSFSLKTGSSDLNLAGNERRGMCHIPFPRWFFERCMNTAETNPDTPTSN